MEPILPNLQYPHWRLAFSLNTASYPSEFYGPSGMEAFTFLVRDQKLGAKIASTLGPTGLAKEIST